MTGKQPFPAYISRSPRRNGLMVTKCAMALRTSRIGMASSFATVNATPAILKGTTKYFPNLAPHSI
jgi:hypothetical protein